MPNVGSVLREEISRLSRREIRKQTLTTKKAAALHRHHIAALNRKVTQLERQVALLTHKMLSPRQAVASNGEQQRVRFVAKGLHSNRSRLGLSAADFGKLLGVSAQSVYNWERGEATPRGSQLAKIASLRGIGKREVVKRLELLQGEKPATPRKRAKRGPRKPRG
jgi:DNA-binding transcriptional regulator YiaG